MLFLFFPLTAPSLWVKNFTLLDRSQSHLVCQFPSHLGCVEVKCSLNSFSTVPQQTRLVILIISLLGPALLCEDIRKKRNLIKSITSAIPHHSHQGFQTRCRPSRLIRQAIQVQLGLPNSEIFLCMGVSLGKCYPTVVTMSHCKERTALWTHCYKVNLWLL